MWHHNGRDKFIHFCITIKVIITITINLLSIYSSGPFCHNGIVTMCLGSCYLEIFHTSLTGGFWNFIASPTTLVTKKNVQLITRPWVFLCTPCRCKGKKPVARVYIFINPCELALNQYELEPTTWFRFHLDVYTVLCTCIIRQSSLSSHLVTKRIGLFNAYNMFHNVPVISPRKLF